MKNFFLLFKKFVWGPNLHFPFNDIHNQLSKNSQLRRYDFPTSAYPGGIGRNTFFSLFFSWLRQCKIERSCDTEATVA
jgi:hypothetical protein